MAEKAFTWLHMRLDGLVSLLQFSRGTDDVKGRVSPCVYPDLLQPGQVIQIIWVTLSRDCLHNLRDEEVRKEKTSK